MAVNMWGPLPDLAECERACEFQSWAYESCYLTAEEMYRVKYGDLACFAVDGCDGGHLASFAFLRRAVALLHVGTLGEDFGEHDKH